MSNDKKKPRGRPFKKGEPRPANAGRKKGSGGRRLPMTIPLEIAATLPDSDSEARRVIIERISKEKQQ